MPRALAYVDALSIDLFSAIEEFLADCRLRGLSPRTIEWYTYVLRPFARWAHAQGKQDPDAVSERDLRTFLSERSEQVAPRRLNHFRDGIDRFYRWLMAEGCAEANPAERIRKVREPRKLIPSFTQRQLAALLEQPDTDTFIGLRDHVFMLLLLDTGVRLSEALGLQVHDVDLGERTLLVMGKGSKERKVGFSSALARHLRHYLLKREAGLKQIGRSECPWVFPNQDGGKPRPEGFRKRLKLYGTLAGIANARVSPHTFRHTFALWFVRKGGSPFHLQKILGHSSLDMSRRYCELSEIDAIIKQQELSPLTTMELGLRGRNRLR